MPVDRKRKPVMDEDSDVDFAPSPQSPSSSSEALPIELESPAVTKPKKDAKKRKGDQRKAPDSGKKKPKEAALEYGVDITEVDQSPELTNKYEKMKIEELKGCAQVRLARSRAPLPALVVVHVDLVPTSVSPRVSSVDVTPRPTRVCSPIPAPAQANRMLLSGPKGVLVARCVDGELWGALAMPAVPRRQASRRLRRLSGHRGQGDWTSAASSQPAPTSAATTPRAPAWWSANAGATADDPALCDGSRPPPPPTRTPEAREVAREEPRPCRGRTARISSVATALVSSCIRRTSSPSRDWRQADDKTKHAVVSGTSRRQLPRRMAIMVEVGDACYISFSRLRDPEIDANLQRLLGAAASARAPKGTSARPHVGEDFAVARIRRRGKGVGLPGEDEGERHREVAAKTVSSAGGGRAAENGEGEGGHLLPTFPTTFRGARARLAVLIGETLGGGSSSPPPTSTDLSGVVDAASPICPSGARAIAAPAGPAPPTGVPARWSVARHAQARARQAVEHHEPPSSARARRQRHKLGVQRRLPPQRQRGRFRRPSTRLPTTTRRCRGGMRDIGFAGGRDPGARRCCVVTPTSHACIGDPVRIVAAIPELH